MKIRSTDLSGEWCYTKKNQRHTIKKWLNMGKIWEHMMKMYVLATWPLTRTLVWKYDENKSLCYLTRTFGTRGGEYHSIPAISHSTSRKRWSREEKSCWICWRKFWIYIESRIRRRRRYFPGTSFHDVVRGETFCLNQAIIWYWLSTSLKVELSELG